MIEENSNMPLVSVIVPSYNSEKYIERFLQSILNQTYESIELIIVNDGSYDGTEKIIKNYKNKLDEKKIHLIYHYQENEGQASALNKGLKFFSGKYLLCMDSDDEIMPEYIKECVLFLEQNNSYTYCRGKAVEIRDENPDEIIQTYGMRKSKDKCSFFEDLIYVRNVFYSGYMIKQVDFDQAIPKRDIFCGRGGQNAQILLPLAWYYGEPGYVEKAVYRYYVHSNSHSHSINTSEKIIEQLWNYEKIVTATIENIKDQRAQKYVTIIKKYYSKLRFGNAIDSGKRDLVKKYYQLLKENKSNTFRDFLLYSKYGNKVVRKYLRIKDEFTD